MWLLKRMMKVPWTAKASNKIILQIANETRTLIKNIRKRQQHFLDILYRKKRLNKQ
jgi:DNA-directed RNA polymerase subunit L